MGLVLVDISVSLDGFIARENDESGPIHDWFFAGSIPMSESPMLKPVGMDADVVRETIASAGAVIAGRRTYDFTDGWGGNNPMGVPVIVLTHTPPTSAPSGPTPITFATSIEQAVSDAQHIAAGKDVVIMGGASAINEALAAGLVDEIQLHVAPVLLGAGVTLTTGGPEHVLEPIRVIQGPGACHLRFRVVNASRSEPKG